MITDPLKLTLEDYRSMIHASPAPAHLQNDVLKQAARIRADQASSDSCASAAQKNSRSGPTPRRTTRVPKKHLPTSDGALPTARRRILRPLASVAACIVLAVGLLAVGSAVGWPGTALENGGSAPVGENSFSLVAYAAENPEGTAGKTVLLDSSQFFGGGGSSGPWYNPADQTFWDYPWVGYKYHFFLNCTGNNIESLTYEIEGDRSYFEIIGGGPTAMPRKDGDKESSGYNYTKSATFDYDNQQSITDDRVVELYIGYPLSDSGMKALDMFRAEGYSAATEKQYDTALEVGAAQEIAQSRLKLTATFTDGTTQTKAFVIAPIDNFEAVYSAYWDAKGAWDDNFQQTRDSGGSQDSSTRPKQPKLYTITEVAGS